jgi:Zn-dependent membrane protease YugP
VQHATAYAPLTLRNAVIPVTNIGANLSMPLLLAGIIFSSESLIMIGILGFAMVTVFQLITLPVEYNASSRAIATLQSHQILYDDELLGAKKVLSAAALTYLAALILSVAQLLRLWLLFGGRGRRRS